MHKQDGNVVERLRVQVDQEGGPDSCWTWTGTVRAHGYGVFNLRRRLDVARRVELSGVEAPAGTDIPCAFREALFQFTQSEAGSLR